LKYFQISASRSVALAVITRLSAVCFDYADGLVSAAVGLCATEFCDLVFEVGVIESPLCILGAELCNGPIVRCKVRSTCSIRGSATAFCSLICPKSNFLFAFLLFAEFVLRFLLCATSEVRIELEIAVEMFSNFSFAFCCASYINLAQSAGLDGKLLRQSQFSCD
jgi:hypothetical protein